MLFNSYEFIFAFLPIVFFVYFYLNSKRLVVGAKGFLVFASLFFYSWWNVVYLPIILSSMLFNYVIGNSLNKEYGNKSFSKKSILIFGIVVNLSLLGYFKYADFLIENVNLISGVNIEPLNLLLPLAISFFTFQQIAYLVDSYRKETKEYDFLNYALFVTFFPQLIAGPIVHHKEMMPQFASKWNLVKRYKNIALGLFIFSIGLFKKVVIADTFAIWATNGFDIAPTLNFFEAWATSLSYTFQLYFDFSGYTDMAIGIALLFNIKLPINFNSPYKALDIQDFWRRWHITLSRFLRDYVYIPLGGNRISSFRTYVNLLATFIIGGLWHGAGWTFIFWGFLHGMALVINRLWQTLNIKLPKIIAWFITFNFVNIAWVFFRAREWDDAIKVLSGMVNFSDFELINPIWLVTIIISVFVVLFFNNSMNYINNRFQFSKKIAIFTSFLFFCSFVAIRLLGGQSEFLYFNF
ncbi:membrane-bound O-acyltransferase family protein [Arcobacter sp. CECT 8983]|uniref:MBOAT family O-acyltransferase n=1 Tax=Arcobacter sp. CECT 8983 TaxID=2044508 RepID=UPI00100B88AE|nr:MBOAT family O-acyltransferase [Arcobacter sp. CECT 8983]RXJ90609.1 membrane-bound O-acyltransferase family protein [Arcobacter sp. CECT 8983]